MADTSQARFEALSRLKTLDQFIPARTAVAPHTEALRQFDRRSNTWERISYRDLSERIMVWRRAFAKLGLERGDRVAILLPNGVDSVCCDQAVLANGYVPVPLHAIDTAGSSAYIIADSEAKVLVTTRQNRWDSIYLAHTVMPKLKEVIFTEESAPEHRNDGVRHWDLENWLATGHDVTELPEGPQEDDLAAIVYTSGTTGRPKGVMLSHKNVVSNVVNTLKTVLPAPGSVFLSFLPVSHTFERQCGYYLALGMGCTIVYTRSIQQLAEDFRIVRPNVIISVPRIYERIYAKVQAKLARESAFVRFMFNWAVEVGWRRFCRENGQPVEHTWRECLDGLVADWLDRKVGSALRDVFGGVKPHAFISGGAALNQNVARTFIGLGIEIFQGYGLTETSPILAVNKEQHNNPSTVGMPLPNMQLRIGDNDELQVKGPCVMKGYWNRPEATRETFTEDGWLKTGDQADILPSGHVRIKGRIKEIIVTSTGEKIPPADLEMAIETDPLFAQVMAVGEAMPYVSAIAVLETEHWTALAKECGVDPQDPASLTAKAVTTNVLRRIKKLTRGFPQYGVPRAVILSLDAWTIENGMLTPTLKLKRHVIRAHFQDQIAHIYESHPGA